MIEIEPGPSVSELLDNFPRRGTPARDGDVRFVGSGKAGIRLVFEYLHRQHVLEHKMARVMVPPWLGTWVYAEMLPFAFPTLTADGAKALLCYHQYGFPQNMERVQDIAADRGMVIIEDCAHACASEFKGKAVGSFGEFSVFSFSKFTFCYALGGVSSRHAEFYSFAEDACGRGSYALRAAINAFKLVDEVNLHRTRQIAAGAMNGLRKLAYARYGDQLMPGAWAIALWLNKRADEIQARIDNYEVLRQAVDRWGICDHLEQDGVAPYLVPLEIKADAIDAVVAELRANGIAAGARSFDFARCTFEPDYRKCVAVPIHSGMKGQGMDRLVSGLKKVL